MQVKAYVKDDGLYIPELQLKGNKKEYVTKENLTNKFYKVSVNIQESRFF